MSSDNWQPGDLALCVNDMANPTLLPRRSALKRGGVYTVTAVRARPCPNSVVGVSIGLALKGVKSASPSGCFAALRFRKIHPHVPDAEDIETIALLNGKPVPVEA